LQVTSKGFVRNQIFLGLIQALRSGVSETSVRAAAGWSSGAMVARYTRALSGELAVEEFQRSWEV